jgi:HD-GYP domain-containing protein (c-di-GMP phosphodiesterase class II)
MNDVHLLDLINGASGALDYVSSTVTGHHRRVAIGAVAVAGAMGLARRDVTDLLIAALVHDIGAFSLDLGLDGLDFEADYTDHADAGHRLLHLHPALARASELVRLHHTPWRSLPPLADPAIPLLANVVNLADRVDVLAQAGRRRYDRERIRVAIRTNAGTVFAPRAIEAFLDLSAHGGFWEAMAEVPPHVRDGIATPIIEDIIPQDQLLRFSRFFASIIDFRSRHTATHSQGVAETAAHLARLAGLPDHDQDRMRLAGNLHDIGKLAVPVTLLDKPAMLTDAEYGTVQHHATVCETILRGVPGLEDIADWACQHHERMDGSGYPHGLRGKELSLGSRIMAVCDVFTAITEDRPYRTGMTDTGSAVVLRDMAAHGALDAALVDLLLADHAHIDAVRRQAQTRAQAEFQRFRRE